jgi:hypothetical protein
MHEALEMEVPSAHFEVEVALPVVRRGGGWSGRSIRRALGLEGVNRSDGEDETAGGEAGPKVLAYVHHVLL